MSTPKKEKIEFLCKSFAQGRGVYKVIDENRELFECLLREAPELFERCPYIMHWIARTDTFLVCLLEALEWQRESPDSIRTFPRAWTDNEYWSQNLQELSYKKSITLTSYTTETAKNMSFGTHKKRHDHAKRKREKS